MMHEPNGPPIATIAGVAHTYCIKLAPATEYGIEPEATT